MDQQQHDNLPVHGEFQTLFDCVNITARWIRSFRNIHPGTGLMYPFLINFIIMDLVISFIANVLEAIIFSGIKQTHFSNMYRLLEII